MASWERLLPWNMIFPQMKYWMDTPTESEVQMNLANIDCVGQDEPCKAVSQKDSKSPKQDIEIRKRGKYLRDLQWVGVTDDQ